MVAVDLRKQQAINVDPRAIQRIKFTANLDRLKNIKKFFIIEETKES